MHVPLWLGGLACMAGGAVLAVLLIGAPLVTGGLVLLTLAVVFGWRRRRPAGAVSVDETSPIRRTDTPTRTMRPLDPTTRTARR